MPACFKHPEDPDATGESISNVTIQNILLDQSYNDLGFQIGTRLVVLVEAQSTWTVNIVLRSLMYLTQTWQKYIQNTGQNVYGSKKVEIPRPELYVIYTGSRKTRPKYLCLSREFWGGGECAVEVKVKMIYDGEKGDIISQYVAFTRIYNEQIKQHGRTREAVLETIRICRDRNILREYLRVREQEVVVVGKISLMAYFSHGNLCRNVTNCCDGRREIAFAISLRPVAALRSEDYYDDNI